MTKKVIKGLIIGSICALSANADYKLVLTDKDGVQTEQCIKSYSFSNNLEHLAKQKGVGNDVYSTTETLTSKLYKGKPVYRKVLEIADFNVPKSSSTSRKYTESVTDLERVVNMEFHAIRTQDNLMLSSNYTHHVEFGSGTHILARAEFYYDTKKAALFFRHNHHGYSWEIKDVTVTLEYTKTTDTASTSSSEFKSYLHYLPSSSVTEDVTTMNMKNLGVQLLENYTYDDTTTSCTKN